MIKALLDIPPLLARRAADFLVLVHQLVFSSTPRGDHFVQIPRGGPHGFEFSLAAAFLGGNVEAERLAVSRDRQSCIIMITLVCC